MERSDWKREADKTRHASEEDMTKSTPECDFYHELESYKLKDRGKECEKVRCKA